MLVDRLRVAANNVARPDSQANRLVIFGLALLTFGALVPGFVKTINLHGPGIDLEIPMRAVGRWAAGAAPYVPSSFQAPSGPDLPFLYPPFVLPIIEPLLAVPRDMLLVGWIGICAGFAGWSLARMGIPPWAWPLMLMWRPFTEAIVGGNVHIVLFACFVALFFRRDPGAPDSVPLPADPAERSRSAGPVGIAGTVWTGLLGSTIAALKVSQVHVWFFLLLRRPVAALVGVLLWLVIVAATLPITGLEIWGDWLAQIGRASEPTWRLAGISIAKVLPVPLALTLVVVCAALVAAAPRSEPGPWIGVLAVFGAPSLHTFGLLFLVPAMLIIRREIALVAAMFIAIGIVPLMWFGSLLVAATLAGSRRYPLLRGKRLGEQP